MNPMIEDIRNSAKTVVIALDGSGQTEAAIQMLGVIDACNRADRALKEFSSPTKKISAQEVNS